MSPKVFEIVMQKCNGVKLILSGIRFDMKYFRNTYHEIVFLDKLAKIREKLECFYELRVMKGPLQSDWFAKWYSRRTKSACE